VFYSLGICLGAFNAYSSYNPIKKPVIKHAIIIVMLDYLYALIAGFAVYGAIGFLQIMDHP
jgi:SNF family Na+-dependent transporter